MTEKLSQQQTREDAMDDQTGGIAALAAERPVRPLAAVDHAKAPTPLNVHGLEERRLIHRQESGRFLADAFRELRTRLLSVGGPGNFVVLVAPVAPGCGGSFVARNLALAFAFDESKRAVLVDCDATHPSQHGALGVTPQAGGLIDYLDGDVADVRTIRYRTAIPRLELIPNGRVREISGEYFSSPAARLMVESLRAGDPDRYVVLDAPPVLSAPDARILSDLADLVVLVAGYGKVTLESIDKAAAHFDPAKFAGVVFNEGP